MLFFNLISFIYIDNKGADVSAKTNEGRDSLYAAAYNGDFDLCKFLLANGSDVNVTDGVINPSSSLI